MEFDENNISLEKEVKKANVKQYQSEFHYWYSVINPISNMKYVDVVQFSVDSDRMEESLFPWAWKNAMGKMYRVKII